MSGSLEKLLDSLAGTGVPGVAVASAGPGFEWTRAAGVADVESGETLAPEHRFPIASVSKIFTATVVLQLVGEGRLALDGDSGIVEGVTVRQLLNHTSGIPNHFDSLDSWLEPYRVNPRYRPGLTPHTTLELALGRPRLFAPGAGWAYSGTDFLALWLLVEQTTGASLGHELRRRVFEPLGLDATDAAKGSGSSADQVRGYLPADNPLLPGSGPGPVDVTEIDLFGWEAGGGWIVSTPLDVSRFLGALLGGEVLSPGLRNEMLTTVSTEWDESDGYGLGIELITSLKGKSDSPCGPAWGHLGFALGYTTVALASETGDHRVVIMANTLLYTDEQWDAAGRLAWACFCRASA